MAFPQFLQNGLGTFGQQLFPVDPGMSVPGGASTSPAGTAPPLIDPAAAQAIQRNAVLNFGLGLMAARDDRMGLGHGLQTAFQGAQTGAQQAMDNAFKHTLLKREADYQQQERDRQAKVQQQQDRQSAATTATRVAGALQSPQYSANPSAYWDIVKNNPDVQAAIQQAGVQLPQGQAPDYGALAQQLGSFGQTSAAPTAARDLNLKAVMGPNGKPILVPETQAIGATPYEKPTEVHTQLVTRPTADGKSVQDFNYDPINQKLTPIGQPYTPASKGGFGDQSGALLASLAAKGVALPTGMRSKEQMAATLNGLLTKFPNNTPDEIADMIAGGQIDFGAAKKETQTAAAQAGRVAMATNELNTFAPLVLQASAAVPRGSFVPINRLMQMGEAQISDPNLRQLKIGINSMLNAYDQLAARGGTDMNKRAEAHALLSSADSPEALAAAVQMFQKEAQAAGDAAAMATKYKPPSAGLKQIQSDADYEKLPSGAEFIAPDGSHRRKP